MFVLEQRQGARLHSRQPLPGIFLAIAHVAVGKPYPRKTTVIMAVLARCIYYRQA